MRIVIPVLFSFLAATGALAQGARQFTPADYARAEKYMGYNAGPLVFGATVRPVWLAGDRFWYRDNTPPGVEIVLVDPAARTRARAFDQVRLAAALSQVADTTYDPFHLPTGQLDSASGGKSLTAEIRGKAWSCDFVAYRCLAAPARAAAPRSSVT